MSAASEQAVIWCAIHSDVARKRAGRIVTGEDFDSVAFEAIWDATRRLEQQKRPVDPVTVLELVGSNRVAREAMLALVGVPAVLDNVEDYANRVRSAATKRRLASEALRVIQLADNPDVDGHGLAPSVVNRFTAIRDSGLTDDIESLTLRELMDEPEEPYSWVVPGLLEHGDRFVLTGHEGLGKSMFLRQVAVASAAGLDPFGRGRIEPIKAVIVDAENTKRQVKRKIRPMTQVAYERGQDPRDRINIWCPGRIDITTDRDLAGIHRLLDAAQPDVVVIGPLYRLVPRAVQTDDEAAPLLTALDTIRDRGIALLIEAHAGHGKGAHGARDLRPRGSSALLGWPEFGYGMQPNQETEGEVELVAWRGDRDERNWPDRLSRDGVWPWSVLNFHGIPINDTWSAS